MGTGNNPPALWGNIHTCHSLIMPDEFLLEFETIISMCVQFDLGIARHCEEGPVCAEGVIRDGLVEEEMYFGGYHDECFSFGSVEDVMAIFGDDRSSTRLSARCGVDGRGEFGCGVWNWGLAWRRWSKSETQFITRGQIFVGSSSSARLYMD